MIAKVSTTSRITRSVLYGQDEQKGGQVLLYNCVDITATPEEQAADLNAMSNPSYRIKGYNFILSFDDKDTEKLRHLKEKERYDFIRKVIRAFIEEMVSWIYSFVVMFAVALFLTQFIIINAVIPSGSMEDTIMTHDRLIGARFSYWFSEPERGDIVIFHYPVEEDRIYIKRVIGLPGETVRIEDGKIFINDSAEPLKEGYLKEAWDVMNTDFTFVVPADSYLMLGDNRNWSEDARYWADNAMNEGLADTWEEAMDYSYVRKNKILGKAIFTYFRKFRILQHGTWYE